MFIKHAYIPLAVKKEEFTQFVIYTSLRSPNFIPLLEALTCYLLKGFIADLHGGFVVKQLNYPFSMLSILFRSVDRIVNDH